ncbi:MAG: response regulator [Pseudomonadota bacterium]
MKILIADDNPTNLKLLSAQLHTEGFSVVKAADGVEALATLRREPVDALISDVLMPHMDGYKLCFEVRNDPQLADTPVIFYTATFLSDDDERLGYKMGADKFLRKPAGFREIVAAVKEVTGAARRAHAQRPASDELGLMNDYNTKLVEKLKEKNIELADVVQRLQLAEARYRALIEQAADGILTLSAAARFEEINPRFTQLLGYSQAELVGRHVADFVSAAERSQVLDEFARMMQGQNYKMEWGFLRKDGSVFAAEIRGNLLSDGRVMMIVRDVSERKKTEDAMAARAAELERFHELSVGRELQMIELKKQVNTLSVKAGLAPPYDLSFVETP